MKKMRSFLGAMLLITIVLTVSTGCNLVIESAYQEGLLNRGSKHLSSNEKTDKEHVQSLVNAKYRKYFENLKLFCCDDGSIGETYYATVYSEDENFEFFVEYDKNTDVLLTTASEAFHRKAITDNIEKIVAETIDFDSLGTEQYSLKIETELSENFLEDYDKFITDTGTKIKIALFYDKSISNVEAMQIISLMQTLKNKGFNGNLIYYTDEDFSKDLDISEDYTVEELMIPIRN